MSGPARARWNRPRQRTATVLANVATGVVALDAGGRVVLANPRAEEILGTALPAGEALGDRLAPAWAALDRRGPGLPGRAADETGSAEVDVHGRRIRLQLARLVTELRGLVLALDDLTDVSHAERVLAWGEMARQVAHEIKNPLTPLRLGIQHLQRVHRDRRRGFRRDPSDHGSPDPGGDRPAGHHRARVQPLRRAGGRRRARWSGSTLPRRPRSGPALQPGRAAHGRAAGDLRPRPGASPGGMK